MKALHPQCRPYLVCHPLHLCTCIQYLLGLFLLRLIWHRVYNYPVGRFQPALWSRCQNGVLNMSESFSYGEYPISCITADDGMSKQTTYYCCKLHVPSLSAHRAYLIFQHRGLFFVPDLISGFTRIFLDIKHRSTSRSMSSPNRTDSQDIADCTVVSTIRTYIYMHHPWHDVFCIQRVPSFALAS